MKRFSFSVLFLMVCSWPELLLAAEDMPSGLEFSHDLRAGVAENFQQRREGSHRSEFLPVVRLRGGIRLTLTPELQLQARAAGFIDKDTDQLRFNFEDTVQSGEVTLDSLNLTFTPHENLSVILGRFQTAFELDSVVQDSLSRHDSSGLGVDWTQGMHLIAGGATKFHYISQFNHKTGPTNGIGTRGPVSFVKSRARITHFFAAEMEPIGPLTQLIADVTFIPESLYKGGLDTGRSSDLIAFTLKAAADFPLANGMIFHPSLEIGTMLSAPQSNALGLTGEQQADSSAIVIGLDLINVGPGALGLQIARVQPGFLLSPDYPANAQSAEIRYTIPISPESKVDIRYRFRQDINKELAATSLKTDQNILFRYTVSF